MFNYTPFNWYWLAQDGRIYSSQNQAIIKKTDSAYKAWQDTGNQPTPWPKDENGNETNAALQQVLLPYGLNLFKLTLDELKRDLQNKIDTAAENERLKYITNGTGQAMTYQEKVAQAERYTAAFYAHKADPETNKEPNDAEYPLLSASLDIDGDTLADVAELVTYSYAMWQQVGAIIETTRLQSKAAIDKATTLEEAQAVVNAITWPQI